MEIPALGVDCVSKTARFQRTVVIRRGRSSIDQEGGSCDKRALLTHQKLCYIGHFVRGFRSPCRTLCKHILVEIATRSVELIYGERRAFSDAYHDAYHNEILAESKIYIELSAKNPLSKLDALETNDLKNMSCILVINQAGQQKEQKYYENIIGLHGDFLFTDTIQKARLKSITGQGYLPVDVIGEEAWFDTTVSRIPLMRSDQPVQKVYCAFWRKDNSGYYIEEFAEILKSCF